MKLKLKIIISLLTAILLHSFAILHPIASNANENEVNYDHYPSWETQYNELISTTNADKIITARHRGSFDSAIPENSMGAFAKAFNACQPAIETDVRTTADGELVLFHDTHIGKMLEPDYNPEENTGPNQPLKNIAYTDLIKKHLVRPDHSESHYTVPTVNDLINYMIDNDANSIVHFEVKEYDAILEVARLLNSHNRVNPSAEILKRAIIKFNIAAFPTPQSWTSALKREGIFDDYLVMPVITPSSALQLNQGTTIENPSEFELSTNASRAVALWGEEPHTFAPIIEVVVKDSSEFLRTSQQESPFGDYLAPTSVDFDNVKTGTVAEYIALTHFYQKKLGVFVPVPDYVLFPTGPTAGYTVPNTFGDHTAIPVNQAFFNNNSSCCYQLSDRRSSTPIAAEQDDWRMNLDWARNIGASIITADDTDTIELYALKYNYLNTEARPSPVSPPEDMYSTLAILASGNQIPNHSLVRMKGWNGGSAEAWGGEVCLRSDPGRYLWTAACSLQREKKYSAILQIETVGEGKMHIKDPRSGMCAFADPSRDDTIFWSENCEREETKWNRTPQNRYLDKDNREINFQWDDRYTYGIPFAYNYLSTKDTSSWSQWKLEPVSIEDFTNEND